MVWYWAAVCSLHSPSPNAAVGSDGSHWVPTSPHCLASGKLLPFAFHPTAISVTASPPSHPLPFNSLLLYHRAEKSNCHLMSITAAHNIGPRPAPLVLAGEVMLPETAGLGD